MKILFVIAFILVSLFVYIIDNIEFSKQLVLLESLKQISSIILAITGAWAAIIYPDSLKNIIVKKKSYQTDMTSIKNLLRPMISSLVILCFIVGIEFLGFTLKLLSIPDILIPYLRNISLIMIIYLYFIQLWTLVMTILPIYEALKKAQNENERNEYIDEVNN